MKNKMNYALIIGINDYQELNPLSGPTNDAKNFKEWVLSNSGGNIPTNNCHIVLSQSDRPIQDDIDEKLIQIYQKGNDGDGFKKFYFFFAGHGLGVNWNENGLCLPKWSQYRRNYALSSSAYLKIMVESGYFEEIYFFLDCCSNRKVGVNPIGPTIGWPKPGNLENINSFVAYASEFDNAAHEAALENGNTLAIQGFFTKALMNGLKGEALDEHGNITLYSLKSYLPKKVKELSDNKQSVRFEDSFRQDTLISSLNKSLLIDLLLTFKDDGNIELKGPTLDVIFKEHTSKWPKFLSLAKGIYHVSNLSTGNQSYIQLDINLAENGLPKPKNFHL